LGIKEMNKIPHYTWSFSSLGLFECPKKYELLRAKRLIESPKSEAGNEGARLHELIEAYIKGGELDPDIARWKRILDVYKEKDGKCEEEYAFKWIDYNLDTGQDIGLIKYVDDQAKLLVRCKGDDPDRWYLGFIDWMKIDGNKCEIADWKTGKVKVTKQLQLYAWVVMLAHPEVDTVKVTFHFLNYNDQVSDWFYRKDMDKMFKYFQDILDDIDNCYRTDVWFEIPGDIVKKTGRGVHCSYCPATLEHCSHGKETF
jgi:hypothetical protein